VFVAVFVLAFKKVYIAKKAVDQQEGKSQEENRDKNI
jgi:hypothetical protein